MTKKIALFAVAVLACGTASAQKIENFKARLAEPTLDASLGTVGRVVVREVGTAAAAVRQSDTATKPETIKGFRIVIFFDNSNTARAKAEQAIMTFNSLYPDVRSYMDYENPYFKVLVGGCVTSEEAIVLLGRITPNFPKAYITREEIKLTELSRPRYIPAPAEPITDSIANPVTTPAPEQTAMQTTSAQ